MSDLLEIRMPADQSEGTRSQVLRWLKAEGEAVSQDEPLIEMETDKVTVEIAAPHAGVLRQILKPEQSDVEPGELLGFIEAEGRAARGAAGEAVAHSAAPQAAAIAGSSDVRAAVGAGHSAGTPAGSSSVRADADAGRSAGTPAGSSGVRADADAGRSAGTPAGSSSVRADADAGHDVGTPVGSGDVRAVGNARGTGTPARTSNGASTTLSPAVRRLLSENGLSASDVTGTGIGGRITVDDVLAQVSQRPAERRSQTIPATPQQSELPSGTRRVPHSAVRKRVAEHMVRSLMHTAPHVTSVFEADMSAVIAHRARHRDEFERKGSPLTFTVYFLSAIVDAIRAVPEANSRWTDDALEIYDSINIGVGTALGDQGLVVPVIQHVESLTLEQIAAQLHAVVSRAREGQLTPDDVRGGTFTISNHGVSGSLIATPIIINQPQSAILGIGKLDQRVVPAKDGSTERFTVLPKCYVTLTIDHRVMDGFQANRFLQTFVRKLETW